MSSTSRSEPSGAAGVSWSWKMLTGCSYAGCLLVCSLGLADLAFAAHYGMISAAWNPLVVIASGVFGLGSLWYVYLALGVWFGFFPPCGWSECAKFWGAVLVAGVWGSYAYQMFAWPEYPFEAGMERIPPTFSLISSTTAVACGIALVSTTVNFFFVRRLLR